MPETIEEKTEKGTLSRSASEYPSKSSKGKIMSSNNVDDLDSDASSTSMIEECLEDIAEITQEYPDFESPDFRDIPTKQSQSKHSSNKF
jgi:hypothetical protein